jgi:ABC-2 type transport system ATP-binding protein
MFKISEISKKYFRSIALNKVSFEVQKGGITGIIGPNGAGKSTLLDIITGFQQADSGKISYNGKELKSFNEKKKVFSYMPENMQIYPDIYTGEFLTFIQKATNCFRNDLIEILGLNKVLNKRIKFLSKGYHQRLKIFSALANNKKIVILDEPFDGFDPIQLIEILNLIKTENSKAGRTFILSIHQLFDAEKICSQYILLDEGRLVASGTLAELRKSFEIENASLEEIFIKALV